MSAFGVRGCFGLQFPLAGVLVLYFSPDVCVWILGCFGLQFPLADFLIFWFFALLVSHQLGGWSLFKLQAPLY
ncbi:unnamed protein product [Camellia sinensis]